MCVFKRLLCGLIGFAAILTSVFLSACSRHGRTLYQSDAFRISWLIEPAGMRIFVYFPKTILRFAKMSKPGYISSPTAPAKFYQNRWMRVVCRNGSSAFLQ